ncbi:Nuclear transcription factor Y subunit [Phytophthora megakarya]|uniref:Nuclear transcription factor Y subunit n=1 Tax=Phytophthora megakarya TaxID=4795 RepID=A0A225W4U3_9STRA|nr:Nuclear transcription factor Y subunit [Phytophthora megakarya]
MLELRLVNPEPLTGWKFQASFTDTSVSSPKTIILDDLTVDDENCLLFDNAQPAQGPASSRYFNPFLYFTGLCRPSDLYGHVLRIIVTSIKPVTRIVINTAVQFTHSSDEPAAVQLVQSTRQHPETTAKNFLRATVGRSKSASSASRRRISKPRKKKTVKHSPSNNHEISTTSLAMDQCSPWVSSDQDELVNNTHSSVVEQVYTLHLEEPRSPSPAVTPRGGPTTDHRCRTSHQQPLPTIDKKKMELQRLRANMRVSHYKLLYSWLY